MSKITQVNQRLTSLPSWFSVGPDLVPKSSGCHGDLRHLMFIITTRVVELTDWTSMSTCMFTINTRQSMSSRSPADLHVESEMCLDWLLPGSGGAPVLVGETGQVLGDGGSTLRPAVM